VEVAFNQDRLASFLLDQGGDVLQPPFVEVGDQDVSAFAREGYRDLGPDAAVPPGDDGALT
jgi:hypothetical protein